MSRTRVVRGTVYLLMLAVVLGGSARSFGTISFSSNTLTYSSPSDLGTTIDPAGQKDVATSYGLTKASFQALGPQVVAFNGAPAPTQTLRTLVASYNASSTVTFTFPSAMYNYGSMSSLGRGAFSGSAAQDAISTVPVQNGSLYDWFDASITSTGGQGVQSLGFCAAFRNDQAVAAGQVLVTLSDATTATITLPALGGSGNPEYVFIGYTAPTGKTIARVQASQTSGPGGGYVSIDDLSFVMSSDTTAPAAVSDLACSTSTASSVTLTWTAPGDDNSTGTAASYDIRYSTSTIDTSNWASATQVSGEPTPAAAGTGQNMTVSGLSGDTTYYFAMKTSDEVPNVSALSNVPSRKTTDSVAPASVSNLACSASTASSVTLTWTAPGDNGGSGTATTYDIRYSTAAITAGNWASATQVTGEPTPAAAGTGQSMTVGGLSGDTTYYFAIETADEVPNWSSLSNVPSRKTADTVAPAAVSNLATSSPTSNSITLTWTAPGDNGGSGTATTYDIRYSTSTITSGNWASATQVSGEPAPAAAGTAQNMVVSGLSAGTTYYFAIETADEVPNWSALSNVPSGSTTTQTCTWTGGGGSQSWTVAGNWNPAVVPGAGMIGSVNLSSPYPVTDADLTGSPTIQVGASGLVCHKNGITLTTPVTLNGGTWHLMPDASYAWGADRTLSAGVAVTAASFMKGGRGTNLSVTGLLSGSALLTFQSVDNYLSQGPIWYFSAANSTFSGGVIVDAGNNPAVWANASRALGTGDFTVRSTGLLGFGTNQDYSGAARTPVLYLEGGASGMGDHLSGATLPFNVVVQGQGGTMGAGTWVTNNIYSGTVTLNGPLTLAGSRGTGGTTACTITGRISGGNTVTLNTTDQYQNGRSGVTLANATNNYTGGTILQMGYLTATSEGALSTGPITLYTPDSLTRLYLDKTTDANWTIGNGLLGTGTIQVEGGTGYALNTSGSISPGVGAGNVGTMTVQGNLGFVAGATLAIDLNAVDTQNPAADLVAVTGSVGSLANATLNIGVSGDNATISGRQFTILTCANDLTGQSFGSVTSPAGWTRTMVYANGSVKVTLTLQGGGDTTAPAAVSNLATSSPTSSSITLTWTAPGDDGSTGTATTYDIRYRTGGAVDASNWASATQVTGEPTPAVAGTNQSMTVSGLAASTTYYFAIKTSDEVPNTSAISNSPSGTTSAPADTTAPAAVSNLATGSPTSSTLTLTWTAPGDDGSTGTATSYDIRYRTGGAVNDSNWASATQVTGEPTPAVAGTNQSMTVSGLAASTTYYFAIKTSDEVPNTSGISNSPSATTSAGQGNNKPILGQSDFVYQGYYIVQKSGYDNMAELNYGQGFTHRYVSGQLRFLTFSFFGNVQGGGNHLIEFAPPTGGLGGTITNRTNHWPDIMGGTGLGVGNGVWMGLWFEQSQNRLWTTWAIDYPDAPSEPYTKSFVVRTLNADGTVSNVQGPWGLAGIQQRRVYGGVTGVPSWFQSTYGTGPYSAGWGGYASRMGIGPVSMGPTCYTFPEPTGYPVGDIPTSAFKSLMDHSSGTLGADWYANGVPTSGDRGVRNTDVTNDYDTPYWQSPAPDGLGRWTWGDSNWNTGCWIETPTKQGFILIPKLCNGRTWYETSTLHCERQSAEIQVFDPNMLGQVAQGTRAVWNTYPTNRWEITTTCSPLGLMWGRSGNGPDGGPCGTSYDSTTQTLYVYCVGGTNWNSYILVYHVN